MENFKVNGLVVDKIPGQGKKILFVHGSNGGSWYFENYMKFFNSKGYEVYANNLRGHAPNPDIPNLGTTSVLEYIEDTKAVVEEVKPDIIMGHSMGGLISQKIAEMFDLDAAVFMSSAPAKGVKFRVAKPFAMAWYGLKQVSALKKGLPLKMIYKMARKFALNNMTEEEAEAFFKKFVPESSKAGLEVGKDKVVEVDATKIKCPILVVGCKKDMTAPWKMARDIAAFYNNAELLTLENNGHMFPIESNWEETAQLVLDWIKKVGL